MKYVVTGLRYVLALVSSLALLLTLVLVVSSNEWWVQATGFLRLQTLMVLAGCLVAWGLLSWPAHRRARYVLLLACGLGLVVQAWFLWPYLPFAPQAVPTTAATSRPTACAS